MLARAVEAGPWEVTGDDLVTWAGGQAWDLETRRSARASCRVFFAWAVATGRREDDPSSALAPVQLGPPSPNPVPEDVLGDVLAGVPGRVSLMIRLADLLTVQGLLGHASPATTQRYVRPPGEAARRTVLAVARAA